MACDRSLRTGAMAGQDLVSLQHSPSAATIQVEERQGCLMDGNYVRKTPSCDIRNNDLYI